MAITIAGNFGLTSSKALDDRCVVDTFSTLISGSYTGTNTYKGMQVYVTDEDAYYKLNTQLDAGVAIDSADYWDQVTALDATPSVDSAEKDGDGNVITDTYLPLVGGTIKSVNTKYIDIDGDGIDIYNTGSNYTTKISAGNIVVKDSDQNNSTIAKGDITLSSQTGKGYYSGERITLSNTDSDSSLAIHVEDGSTSKIVFTPNSDTADLYPDAEYTTVIDDYNLTTENVIATSLTVDELKASNIVHKITDQRIWLNGIYDRNDNLLSNNLGIGLGTDDSLAVHFIDNIQGGDIDYITDQTTGVTTASLNTAWSINDEGVADFSKTYSNEAMLGDLYFKGHYIYGSGVSGDTSGGWLRLDDSTTSTQLGHGDHYIKIAKDDGSFIYHNGKTGTENIEVDSIGRIFLRSDASMDIEAYGNIDIISHNNGSDSDINISAASELWLMGAGQDKTTSVESYILLDDTVSIYGPASSFIKFESGSGKINIQPGSSANLHLSDRNGTIMLQIQNDSIKLRNNQGTNFLISGTTIASETEGISFTNKRGEDIYFLLDRTNLSGWKVTNVSGGDLVIQTDGLITDGVESKNTAFADVITFDISAKEIIIASDWALEIPGNLIATGGIEVDTIQAHTGSVISFQNDIEVDAVVTATTLQGSLSTDYLTTGDDELIIDCGNASA